MIRNLAATLTLVAVAVTFPAVYALDFPGCPELLEKGLKQNARTVEKSAFITGRGLYEYRQYLGRDFATVLKSLGSRSHWIDVGAGDAEAMHDLYSEYRERKIPLSQLPFMTAVTKARSAEFWQGIYRRAVFRFDKFEYLVGKYIQEYSASQIAKADLVTDLFAAATYSPDVDQAIAKIARLLKPDGTAIITLISEKLVILDSNGRPVAIETWLQKAHGVKLVKVRRLDGFEGALKRLTLTRTDGPVQIPSLQLVEIHDTENDPAPYRKYI